MARVLVKPEPEPVKVRTMTRRSIVAVEERVDEQIAAVKARLVALTDEQQLLTRELKVWYEVQHMLVSVATPPVTVVPAAEDAEDEGEEPV